MKEGREGEGRGGREWYSEGREGRGKVEEEGRKGGWYSEGREGRREGREGREG